MAPLSSDDESMRVAVYVRVSTEEQAQEGYSLDSQIEMLTNYCISEEWTISKVYRDDGYSGRNTKRPGYLDMMDKQDDWDVLLVVKMDRIHRNSRNFMDMMEELDGNGKMFVSASEALDTTNALGRFAVDMIQRIAQLESEQIGERTYMGMREKAENLENDDSGKKTMGFNPPFGYCIVNGALETIEDELGVAQDIFLQYHGGRTISTICKNLNDRDLLTRRGNPWNTYNLRNILHNPIYAGYMRWEDILIRHETSTAISPEFYNEVQELMASKVRDPSKRNVKLIPTVGWI
ncbi:MAG TPA: recombinase family protein [Candidatus Methanomethylophilaceae archaeon]|nr:recombinase family protein [Candidatus Methanomethylophilaceae archaeon]